MKSGDTLSAIAVRHGVSLTVNNLQMRSIIYPGQKILLAPAPAPVTAAAPATVAPAVTSITPAANGATHIVKAGDTLSRIAAAHGVSLSSVLSANGMNLQTIIYPGQTIKLGATPAPAATPPAPASTPAAPAANPSSGP